MISVVIPAYNEEKSIGNTIDEIKEVLKQNNLYKKTEIIVVDDGSIDNTKKIALQKKVKVISNPTNMGYGYSLKKGIMNSQGKTIIITDADMTYPFSSISKMLKEKEKGFDLVVGSRTGKYYRKSIIKSTLRKILKKIVEFTTNKKLKDINSGLRIFDKETVIPFLPRLCNTFSFTTTQTLAYAMNSLSICYVDIDYRKRVGKSKIKIIRDTIILLKYIIESCIYYNPLKIFTTLSILYIILSIISFIIYYFLKIKILLILGITIFIISIIIFSIGLFTAFIKQIMTK